MTTDRRRPTRLARACPPLLGLVLAVGACGGADDVVYTAERVVVYDPDSSPVPSTTTAVAAGPVVIERIWSPEPAVAEVLGAGAVAGDPVTVDDGPADVVVFDVADNGSFLLQVAILDEGAHTVCIRDACGRVFVEPSR